jgi:hypothetical protein
MKHQKFFKFLESLNTPETKGLTEAISEAYKVCFLENGEDSFDQDKADMLPVIIRAIDNGTIVDDIKRFIKMKDYEMAKHMKEVAIQILRERAHSDSLATAQAD